MIEIALAPGVDPDTQRFGDVALLEGVRTPREGTLIPATPRLTESFALAISSWRGAPVHRGTFRPAIGGLAFSGPAYVCRGTWLSIGETCAARGLDWITVGEFRRFVAATGYRTQAETGDGAYARDR